MVSKETEQNVQQLQMIEHTLHNLLQQRQQFQTQLIEIDSALEALQSTEKAYQIMGNVMVAADPKTLTNDLNQKKEMLAVRIKSVEKREESLKSKVKDLQDNVMKELGENPDK